jgi:hypothetical protein
MTGSGAAASSSSATPVTWHLLVCLDCTKAEVFDTPGERDGWQEAHTRGTGHQRWIVKDQPRGRRDGEG